MKRWCAASADERIAQRLADELGLDRVVGRVLAGRGFTESAAVQQFLAPSWDQLHSPWLMAGMPAADQRLRLAIERRDKILLCGDYDVDGTMAVVLLLTAIRLAGGDVEFYVPHRIREGYGIRPEVVDRAVAAGVRLIISVDTGIRAAETVRRAEANGIDVIITDHHLPEEELPPALAVLNPNRPDCGYPNKDLCGAGVAFKLASVLLNAQGWPEGKAERVSRSLMKLAALATVADIVPLTGENRAIVALGLGGLRERKHPGLQELLRVAGIKEGEAPTSRQVGFQIGPRINAAGRMEDARMVVELLTSADAGRAAEIAGYLDSLNQERRETEKRIREEIFASTVDPAMGMVLAGEEWHRGVVGIVASRVVERYYRPAFVLEIDRQQGVAVGSGRGIPGFHLLEALESMRDLFLKFGGHRFAAGVTLAADRVEEFRERFAAYAEEHLTVADLQPELRLDAEAELSELGPELVAELDRLQPFGHGNGEPLLLLRGLTVKSVQPLGASGRHFKVNVEREGSRAAIKLWDFESRQEEFAVGQVVDAAVRVEADSYSGWSISAKDLRQAV